MIERAMMLETAADISANYPCKLGSHKLLKSTMIRRSVSAYHTRQGWGIGKTMSPAGKTRRPSLPIKNFLVRVCKLAVFLCLFQV